MKCIVRWKLLSLMVILDTCVSVKTCPIECQCNLVHIPRTIRCSGGKLQHFPENISDTVEYLDLSDNLLTELPIELNQFTKLQYLNLARNKLDTLPANLRGLGNLRKLDLSSNDIKDVIADLSAIQQLTRLKQLYLNNNPLSGLEGLRSATLQFLSADACGINVLKNTSLLGLPELMYLSLSSNPLKDIKDPYSPKLKELDLSKCQLNVLREKALQGFPELIDLRLADNPTLVYSTRSETLRHPKLQQLDVSRCDLDRPGLHGFPSLTIARLSSNSIHMLPDYIFAKNRELTHLYLDYNHLDRLNKSSFTGLPRLQVLDLSANGLKTVPSTAFRDNVEMQFLNLSDNYLTDFPKLTSSVISLDLSENLIGKVDPNCLAGLPRLFYLNLSRNLIETMPNGLESGTMRSLILKQNKISSLENVSMVALPELEKLDLSGNRLSKGINPEIFFNNPNLQYLYLSNNPWLCDCKQLYLSYVFLTNLQNRTETLICQSSSSVNGYSWKHACSSEWNNEVVHKGGNKTWGLILVSLLTMIVLSGTIISIRHSLMLKRQARNQRLAAERAEARERLRLLQRRSRQIQDELREQVPEPRINPLELISPPSYEEAVTMHRLARSLDGLDSVAGTRSTVVRITASSESLRSGKKRRARRVRRLRSQSDDNLSRRETRREERLRRARESATLPEEDNEENVEEENRSRLPTPTATKKKIRRLSQAKHGTSTDDEDSDAGKGEAPPATRRIGKVIIRNLDREPRSGYRPSTDGDS